MFQSYSPFWSPCFQHINDIIWLRKLLQRLITEIGNEDYNKLIDHTYVDDISTVTQFKDTFYLHIFSQVVKYNKEKIIFTAGHDVAREYWMKIFNTDPNSSILCDDIQHEIIREVLSQLNGKQMSFYSVHACEIIESAPQVFTGEKM